MASPFTIKNLQTRMAEVKEEIAAIMAKAGPLREARDAWSAEADRKRQEMNAEIKAVEAGLFDLRQEEAMIAKALGGKSLNRA